MTTQRAVVLVLNKERILADLLVRALNGDGMSAFGAASVEEARLVFEQRQPDLVIIDTGVQDAFAFAEMVRGGLKPAEVVALVEGDSPECRDRWQREDAAGVRNVVDKRAGLDILVQAVQEVLEMAPSVGLAGTGLPRVLVVDDEDGIRTTLADYLGTRGYATLLARDGREAVEAVRRDPSMKVVLLDVSMPHMGGLEALRQIMAIPQHPDVIMMTAVADREIAKRTLEAGAFDYVLKPFDLQSMEASIVACLSYSDYHRQPWWKRLVRRGA